VETSGIYLFESSFFDRLQTQGARRTVVAGFLLVLLTFPVVAWIAGSAWWLLLMVVPFTISAVLLDGSVRGLTEIPTAELDERQRILRDRTYRTAYFVGIVTALAGAFWVGTLASTDSILAGGILAFLGGLLGGLPAMLLAWSMPGEVFDER